MAAYRSQDAVCRWQIQAATATADSLDMPSNRADQVHSASDATPVPPDLDRASLMARFEGDAELFQEVAAVFIDDCPRMLGELKVACERGDLVALREAAHALKGAVSNFTEGPARETALAAEQQARHGQSEAFQTAEILEARITEVSAALARATRPSPRLA